jgi:CPA2 family monovalent cation:H+ antiporter-2
MNPGVPIIGRAHKADDIPALEEAGANRVIQPESVASSRMIQFALSSLRVPEDRASAYLESFQGATGAAAIARSPLPYLEVREVHVDGSRLAGQDLREARIRDRFGVTVVSISRQSGEVLLNPPATSIIQPGDKLRVFGLPQQIDNLEAELRAGS